VNIGLFHPILVHFPIGILIFAYILVFYQKWQKKDLNQSISLALLIGSLSALLACITGWWLSQNGEYDPDSILKHQWTGISSTIFGFLAYYFRRHRIILCSVMTVALSITGHLGGSITHGNDYLFPSKSIALKDVSISQKEAPLNKNAKAEFTANKTFLYQEKVKPILEKKCYSCHSETKRKGGLRLDSESFIKKGGKNGLVLISGNPHKSTLYSNLLLPLEDEKHMPPKGKTQLNAYEISILNLWIKKGASFQGEINSETTPPQLLLADIQNSLILNNQTNKNLEIENPYKDLAKPDNQILELLKNEKLVFNSEGPNSNKLSVNFVNIKDNHKQLLQELSQINENIFALKINQNSFSDLDLPLLKTFQNLEKLNLEQTAITDEGFKNLQNLKNLKYLNLYNTAISDKSLATLASFKDLEVLYLWQTNLTSEGIIALKNKLPNLKIESGDFTFLKPDSLKIKILK